MLTLAVDPVAVDPSAVDPAAVAAFFDERAAAWDERRAADADKLASILDYADIREGSRVMDVGCGTGVLFRHYLARGARSVTGLDISEKMLAVAREQHRDGRIRLIHGDAARADPGRRFDRVMVLNALPHFPCARRLVARLARFTEPGGRLTIAHDIGRDRVNAVHHRRARAVSLDLIDERKLASLVSPFFAVDVVRSDEDLYVVSGVRRADGDVVPVT